MKGEKILSDRETAIVVYNALIGFGGQADRDQLETVINWAVDARLDAAALKMALAGQLIVRALDDGTIEYRTATPEERRQIAEAAAELPAD